MAKFDEQLQPRDVCFATGEREEGGGMAGQPRGASLRTCPCAARWRTSRVVLAGRDLREGQGATSLRGLPMRRSTP